VRLWVLSLALLTSRFADYNHRKTMYDKLLRLLEDNIDELAEKGPAYVYVIMDQLKKDIQNLENK